MSEIVAVNPQFAETMASHCLVDCHKDHHG